MDAVLYRKTLNQVQVGWVPGERKRLDDAGKCLAFYHGDFTRYPPAVAVRENYRKPRNRYSLVMQRVVNVLTQNLYREGPRRLMPDFPEASAWLERIYKVNAVDALMQRADAMTLVGDVACVQAVPTADPAKPIDLRLWDASQFVVWLDPEDQRRPWAVAVLDAWDERRRLTLWTEETIDTFLTDKASEGAEVKTSGATAYRHAANALNPWGMLPFTFCHVNLPIQDFWTHGPGTFLAEVNDGVNAALTQTGGSIQFNLVPVLKLRNVQAGWTPSAPVTPGDIWNLPPDVSRADSTGGSDPDAEYLQADSSFVAATWDDLNSYLDHTLEMCGVPPATVRMIQDSARSGVSIIAEQTPLVDWAKSRQRPFGHYEDSLARLVLTLGARHFEASRDLDLEYDVTAQQLAAAAPDPGLMLRWPKMYPQIPGAEMDQSDQWLLDNGLSSRTQLLMRRECLTREEARQHLEETADDLEWEHRLFGRPELAKAEQDAEQLKVMNAAKAESEPDGDESKTQTEPDGDEADE